MPSASKRDLSFPIFKQLPPSAREAYEKAYTNAWRVYGAKQPQPNLEEIAHHVALASLEASYHKTERGRWVAD